MFCNSVINQFYVLAPDYENTFTHPNCTGITLVLWHLTHFFIFHFSSFIFHLSFFPSFFLRIMGYQHVICRTVSSYMNIVFTAHIRRMGKVLFSQVSVCSRQGGIPVPGSLPGHWSQVFSGGGTPVPGSFPGHWSQVLSGGTLVLTRGTPVLPGVPQDGIGLGYPPGHEGYPCTQVRMGCPLARDGVPPPPDRTVERTLAIQWVVCLLRSRRRTFLFKIF